MTNATTPELESHGLRRRQFLAGTAGVAALSLAGCLNLDLTASEQTFGTPDERTQMDGRERHLVFGDNEDPDVAFTLRQDVPLPSTPESRPEWIPFNVVVHHRKELRTDRLTLRLRAPAVDGSGFDANIYLRSPATGVTPSFALDRVAGGWTVIEADDLGEPPAGGSNAPGEANVYINFVINPLSSHPAEELYAEFVAELSEPGTFGRQSRTATGRLTFPFVRADASGCLACPPSTETPADRSPPTSRRY